MTSNAAAPSPLAQRLAATKEEHATLVKHRNYEQAQSLREQCFVDAQKEKDDMRSAIIARQDTERRRLQMAREIALAQIHSKVEKELEEIDRLWAAKKDGHDTRQQQRFELYERNVRMREEAKPVVLSSYVRDLQRSEKQLAGFHMYDEASMVRRKIAKREVEERQLHDEKAESRVQKALAMRAAQIEDEESSFRAKVKNETQLAKFRASLEEQAVQRKFDHIARDMEHAHALELHANPLLKCYQRPAFIAPPERKITLPQMPKLGGGGGNSTQSLVADSSSAAGGGTSPTAALMNSTVGSGSKRGGGSKKGGKKGAAVNPNDEQLDEIPTAGTRGSEYLKRTQGSKFEIPSLCDLYKGGLPNSHPPSPTRYDAV